MAWGAKHIYPLDTKPSTAIGVSIPFNAPNVFFSTYFTKDAIRNNLLNFFLTNKNEHYLNPNFGANLRAFIFEQISNDNISNLKEDIQQQLNKYFSNIKIEKLDVLQYPDNNEINVVMDYSIVNTGITDKIEINFN